MGPTLRQLEYIVAVADHRSFQAAAVACNVSQPGLSSQLRDAETLLGVRLFERDRRRVLITPLGEEIVRRARAVLAGVDDLTAAARGLAQPLAGVLRLGVLPTIAPYLLPQALPEVRRRHPNLELLLREDFTERLVRLLAAGKLDLLLVALEAPLGNAETLALFEDTFVVALPSVHPLAARQRIAERDLLDERVLLLEDGHCLREQALAVCQSAGARELGDFRASSLGTLVQMVSGGSGLTLLPEMAIDVESRAGRGLAIRPFAAPRPKRTIGLAWRSTSAREQDYRLLGSILARTRRRGRSRRPRRTHV